MAKLVTLYFTTPFKGGLSLYLNGGMTRERAIADFKEMVLHALSKECANISVEDSPDDLPESLQHFTVTKINEKDMIGDLFTIEEFADMVDAGGIIHSDGYGSYVKDGYEYHMPVKFYTDMIKIDAENHGFTHVLRYNN